MLIMNNSVNSDFCLGRFEAPSPNRRIERDRGRDRLDGLLHLRRVGHFTGACKAQREVLRMLRGALSRRHVSHHTAPEDPFLHSESHNTLCGHIVSFGLSVLFTE